MEQIAIFRRRVVISTALLLGTCAFANQLLEKSLDEKVRASSVVLIGTVMEIQSRTEEIGEVEYAIVQVEEILKGKAPKSVRVLTKGGIAEQYGYGRVGRRYVFFLGMPAKSSDYYYLVNGRFGMVPADGEPRDWPVPPPELAPHPQE